jgi:hypothetical protein
MTAQVEFTTLEYSGGGSEKFYRAYMITSSTGSGPTGVTAVLQWGSQRNNRHGGQFKIDVSSAYQRKITEKTNEGYRNVDKGSFELTAAEWERYVLKPTRTGGTANAKDFGLLLDSRTDGPLAGTAYDGQPVPETKAATIQTVEVDTIDALAEELKGLMTLAVSEPDKALVQLAAIKTKRKTLANSLDRVDSYLGTVEVIIDEQLLRTSADD